MLGVTLADKYLRMDINNAKDLKDKIETTLEKPKENDDMEIDNDDGTNMKNESTMDQTHPTFDNKFTLISK
jgi:hypothetical protein